MSTLSGFVSELDGCSSQTDGSGQEKPKMCKKLEKRLAMCNYQCPGRKKLAAGIYLQE